MKYEIVKEDSKLNEFTLSLALMDFLPVLFFGIFTLFLFLLTNNYLVLFGGVLSFTSGLVKVIWKILVVVKKIDVHSLFVQMRIFMPLGFIFVLVGFIIVSVLTQGTIFAHFANALSIAFLVLGIIFMVMMIIFSMKLNPEDKKSNYIEQSANSLCQGFFMLMMIFAYLS